MNERMVVAVHAKKGSPGKRAFWDAEHREPDVCSRPMLGEERMIAAALIKTIQDHKGVSTDGHKECVECHQAKHPACFHEYERNGESYLLRTNKQCKDWHTVRECATAYLANDDPDTGNGRTGWTFLAACEALNLDPSYLRKNLASQACNEYWQDEAKIHAFLGFHTGHEPRPTLEEASLHAGRTDQEGESD